MSGAGQLTLLASGVFGARMLGVTGRGQLALLLLLSSIVTALGSLGVPLAVTYWTARDGGLSQRSRARIVSFGIQQVLLVTGLHAAILVGLFADASSAVTEAAVISLAATPGLLVYQYSLAILQGERRFTSFNTQRLLLPGLYAFLVTALYVAKAHSLVAVMVAWDVAVIVPAITSTIAVRRGPAPDAVVDAPPLRELIRFGVKGLLGSVAPLETFQLDQAIVGLFISPAALGLYVVGVAFTNVPRFIGQAIGLVAYPHMAAQPDARGARRSTLRFMTVGFVLCGLSAAVIEVALRWLVPELFGRSFVGAVGLARVLLISALLVSMRRLLADCARGAGLPGIGSASEIAALALFPVAVVVIGGGATGVAWALVVSGGLAVAVVVPRLARTLGRVPPQAGESTAAEAGSRAAELIGR
ncbi:MAG TPA: oligosaccharide flippase family protein [Solirubrobacteraceae bacterium]|nr:oligosaccharide flippase family protein [Solirubrobacteraceae bacterium]